MTQPLVIHWPDHYEPRNCPVHVRNELAMSVAQDRLWAWLIRATQWPDWYFNASNVKILQGSGPDLAKGTKFRWKTFGITITSTILEYVPCERIAWDAHGFAFDGYHAWVLQPTPTACHVLTEETQRGWLARLGALFMPNRMHRFHQLWLEALENQARSGLP
jgi:hypothetical protein